MNKTITREQFETLVDLMNTDRDFELTPADFDADDNGFITETEFHDVFDEAIGVAADTGRPADSSEVFDVTDIEEFQTSLTYNKFRQWGKFFAENSSADELVLREDLSADVGRTVVLEKPEERHEFHGATERAEVVTVTHGAQRVPVYAPEATQDLGEDEIAVAEALGSIDPDILPLVHTVTLNPVRNPDDSFWEKEYHTRGLVSYMSAGKTGEITVYPSDADPLYTELAMQHEIGHVWSQGRWTTDQDSVHWRAWKTAVTGDGAAPSSYSTRSIGEDFSDAFSLYFYFRNNPRPADEDIAKLRGWFPELFRSLDATGNPDLFLAFAEVLPNRFAVLAEIAEFELTGPFALDSRQWREIHTAYIAAERFEMAGNAAAAAREYEKIIALDAGQNEAKRWLLGHEIEAGNAALDAGNAYAQTLHYQRAFELDPAYPGLKEALAGAYLTYAIECYARVSSNPAIPFSRVFR